MKTLEILKNILLNRINRVDRFDANYIEDFHHICKENYDIHSVKEFAKNKDFAVLKDQLDLNNKMSLLDVTSKLKTLGLDETVFTPAQASDAWKTRSKKGYNQAKSWSVSKGVKAAGTTSIDLINGLQQEYSFDVSGGKRTTADWKTQWAREETGDVWTPFLQNLVATSQLSKDSRALTLGPRFLEEIRFFRNELGFVNTIGLDLMSYDEDLIKVGDMHEMPFENNTFNLIYQRNTFNKAYDIRKTLDECVRVSKDGGIIISDEVLDYTIGVSELGRTNITSNKWYTSYLKEHVDEVLVDKEYTAIPHWINKVGLYAVKIKK